MVQHNAKLTSNAGESDISSLLGNGAVFSIPFFQRPYKWTPARLTQLHSDVLQLVDDLTDLHFLGAVIVHGLPSNPAEPRMYEVIDGQQRITTMYLHICGAVKTLIGAGELDEAENLFRRYLVTSVSRKGSSNLTLHPSKEDRADLNGVIRDILDTKDFSDHVEGFTFRPLPGGEPKRGRIAQNYEIIKKFYKDQHIKLGIDQVRRIYACVLQRMSVVQIDVQDPTNGPKIFDSLNSRQEPMTIGDLVRNDVFTRVALSDPDLASTLDEHHWQPFYRKFENQSSAKKSFFDDYFFPYGLIDNPNLRKSEAYLELKRQWANKDPEAIVKDLSRYQDPFLDLVKGTNGCLHTDLLATQFRNFTRMGAPSSTYPFLMRLSAETRDGGFPEVEASKILLLVESFLIRRALMGIEPTGLHAVFKRLWSDCQGNVTVERVKKEIGKHKTVRWPSDAEVGFGIINRPIYGAAIAPYVIVEADVALGGDVASDVPWIEHILPTSQSSEWTAFSSDEHRLLKDTLANLIPLSSAMNQSLGNKSYGHKRQTYRDDSMFKSTRTLAENHSDWTPVDLASRAESLSDWAVKRWPY